MNPAHLDYDTLADLAEGLLDDDRAASVDEHLTACAECRDRSAELADVSRILAAAPVPALPPDLTARIDSALAAESRAAGEPPGVTDLARRRARRNPWRALSAAAAAIVVLGGGGLVGRAVLDGADDGKHLTASVPPQPMTDPRHPNVQSFGAGWRVVHSGTAYRAATLDSQVTGQLSRVAAAAAVPDARTSDCVAGVAPGRAPALVDVATYDGRPATIIAVRGADGRPDVWVVGPGCTARNPDVLAHSG